MWERELHALFCDMVYLPFTSDSISDTDNCIEFQWQENHGPESNVAFSFPHQPLASIFLSFLDLTDEQVVTICSEWACQDF